jgi:hypothetical protein
MDTLAYKTRLEDMCIVSGTVLNRLIKRIRIQTESNILVTEYNAPARRIVVNGALYNAWLENGGCPEALLGYLISNRSIMDANVAKEQKDVGVRAWEMFVGMDQVARQSELRDAFRSYIVSYMLQSLTDLTDAEKEACGSEPAHRERVMKCVKEQLEHFSHNLTDDVGHLALHLVAKCRFYFTSAYDILDSMREVSLHNPDIDPREAAAVGGFMNYIADYLVGQIAVAAP